MHWGSPWVEITDMMVQLDPVEAGEIVIGSLLLDKANPRLRRDFDHHGPIESLTLY